MKSQTNTTKSSSLTKTSSNGVPSTRSDQLDALRKENKTLRGQVHKLTKKAKQTPNRRLGSLVSRLICSEKCVSKWQVSTALAPNTKIASQHSNARHSYRADQLSHQSGALNRCRLQTHSLQILVRLLQLSNSSRRRCNMCTPF